MKRIVVCSDGTGNSSNKGRGTNVFKLFESLDLTGHHTDPELTPQIALYDDGVGTEDFKPLKVFAGATGFGLSRNVRQLYRELVRVYDPGDEIFVFGFSRGAFTVRSLVGFIATCGLLDARRFATSAALRKAVRKAYRLYRQCYRTKLQELLLGPLDEYHAQVFRSLWCHPGEVRVRFVGVWDTVDAVGLPFHLSDILNSVVYRFKFPDQRLSAIVDEARHALAMDDERHSFHPLLWDERGDPHPARIDQVWFAGAHSNVGGGYPKQGMSLVALDWMAAKARAAGLRLIGGDRQFYGDHANVDDKLYDPRSGAGIFYRWKIRDVASMCARNGVTPKVHVSVLERVAHGTDDYAPGNFPFGAQVVVTPEEAPAGRPSLTELRAAEVQDVLKAAPAGSLLDGVKPARLAGLLSYYLYLIAITLLVLVATAGDLTTAADPRVVLHGVGGLVVGILTSPFATLAAVAKQVWKTPSLLALPGFGLLLAYGLALSADRRMNAVFSGFWHTAQPALRKALMRVRERMIESAGADALAAAVRPEALPAAPPATATAELQHS